MKTISELINLEEPGWQLITAWLNDASNPYEILTRSQERATQELLRLHVSTRSPMGAIVYQTGGILIDHGWLRILGSGNDKLDRGLSEWNKGKTFESEGEQPAYLLIADDIIGGYFAVNAGGIGTEIGKVYYLAQDTLEWEYLDTTYSEFIYWAFTGDLNLFYESFMWKNWQEDIRQVNGNEVFAFLPFLWTEDGKDIENTHKNLVPIEENFWFTLHSRKQINAL